MTERERIAAVYARAQKRNPPPADETQLRAVAAGLEQRRSVWVSMAFLGAGLLCAAVWCLLSDSEINDTFRGFCIVFYIVSAFEYFRILTNASGIRVHYFGSRPRYQGILTRDMAIGELRKAGRVGEQNFRIVMARLHDKDDRDDSMVSLIYHKYNLYFQLEDGVTAAVLRVKRGTYLTAPIDEMYLLLLTPGGTALAAYRAQEWEISAELRENCGFDVLGHNETVWKTPDSSDPEGRKDPYLVWNVLLLVTNLLFFFVPVLAALVYYPVAAFFAAKFTVKRKSVLSIINAAACWFMLTFLVLILCL